MVANEIEDARRQLIIECTWLQTQRGHAKIAYKMGDDPSHIVFLNELIDAIQKRINALGE
jgi:hypothetical protein